MLADRTPSSRSLCSLESYSMISRKRTAAQLCYIEFEPIGSVFEGTILAIGSFFHDLSAALRWIAFN